MKTFVQLIIFLLSINTLCHAQSKLPVIYSFKTDIDVRIDGKLKKAKFTLLPQHKPDIYSVDPDSSPDSIEFITDIDSVSISLKDESDKDLIIVLNGKNSCFVRVVHEKTSYFTSPLYAYTLMAIALLTVIAYLVFHRKIPLKVQLSSGWISATLFWLMLFVCGFLQKDYDHLTMKISDLANVGSASAVLLSLSLLVITLLVFCFAVTLVSYGLKYDIMRWPFALLTFTPLLYFYPMWWPYNLKLGVELGPDVISVLTIQIISLCTWLRKPQFKLLRASAVLCIILFALGLLQFTSTFKSQYTGLFQRLFHLSWSLFLFIVSLILLRLNTNNSLEEIHSSK